MSLKELIEMAIAPNQSKKEFAKELDISPEYLSRICNGQNKPSKQLLKEISEISACPQVTYKKLLQSANYPLQDIENPLEIGEEIVKTLNKQKEDYIYPIVASPNQEINAFSPFLAEFLKGINKNIYLQDFHINCYLQQKGEIQQGEYENYIFGKLVTHTDSLGKFPYKKITIPFVILGHWSLNNKFYIEDVSFEGRYLKNILPPPDVDILYEEGYDIDSLPSIIYVEDIKKQYQKQCEKIYDKIFNKTKHLICDVEGLGFYMDEFPPKLLEFVKKHKNQIVNNDDPVLMEKINNLDRYSDEEIKSLLEEEDTHNGDSGWQAMIANVMKKETGYLFTFWDEDKDVPEPFRTKPVILVSDESIKNKDDENKIKMSLIIYANELGLDKYERVYSQFVGVADVKEYPVK